MRNTIPRGKVQRIQ